MSRLTVIGIVMAIGLLLGAIWLQSRSFEIFYSLPGIIIVLGGTTAATFMSYPLPEVFSVVRNFFVVLKKEPPRLDRYLDTVMGLVVTAADGGNLALEREVPRINNLFLRDAVQMLADGYGADEIRSILEDRVSFRLEQERREAEIFRTMGRYAPAAGLIGTLIGLIILLANLNTGSLDRIGGGMAVALTTTFYGVVLANLLLKPIAVKLEQRTFEEVRLMQLVVESIVMISEQWHPAKVRDYLNSFLRPGQRQVPDRMELRRQSRPVVRAEQPEVATEAA